MPLFLTPKDIGRWPGSALLDCFLPLENGLENSPLEGVFGLRKLNQMASKNQKVRDGGQGELGRVTSSLNLTFPYPENKSFVIFWKE